MAWLRIDDGFAEHPKLIALGSPADRWTWLELLVYCARRRTRGQVPSGVHDVLRRATPGFLERCHMVGLLDKDEDGYAVHDWETYNPSDSAAADRMRRRRYMEPRVSGARWDKTRTAVYERDKGVCADCGEKKEGWNADHEPHRAELVEQGRSIYDPDYIVTRCHSCHAKKTRREAVERANQTEPNTEPLTEPADNGSLPPARARARGPSPSPLNPVLNKTRNEGFTCPHCGIRQPTERKMEDHLANVHDKDIQF